MTTAARPALPRLILLDRDGVLLAHREPYILTVEDLETVPGSLRAAARLVEAGCALAIVTNQSPIGRGLVSEAFVAETNRWLIGRVGGAPDAVRAYVCPHVPEAGCACRKPQPGLLLRALRNLGVRPDEAWMVGDHDVDMLAARRAGIGERVHVRSGRQREVSPFATRSTGDLADLVRSLLPRVEACADA